MKKTLFLVIAFVSISIGVKAQGTERLIGNWEFLDIPDRENLDEKTVDMLTDMFGDMSMNFYEDGTYLFTGMGEDEEGTYTFEGKNLTSTDEKGRLSKSTITFLPDNQILFTKGSIKVILFKVELEEEIEEELEEEENAD